MTQEGEPKLSAEEVLLRAIFGSKYEAPPAPEDALSHSTGLEAAARIHADYSSVAPMDVEETVLEDMLNKTLAYHLTPREALVLRSRFGLEDGQPRTLAETGRAINRSKSTAWRIEAKAIKKLRGGVSFMKQFQELTGESLQ